MRKISVIIVLMMILIAMCGCSKGAVTPSPAQEEPVQPTNSASPNISVTLPEVSSASEEPPEVSIVPEAPKPVNGEVVITFEFLKQSGSASNQYAVWIENMQGKYIKTLYASKWTVNGGYKTRPEALYFWSQRAKLAAMPQEEIDAISGATPSTGAQSYTWDLTDTNGVPVPAGEYMFLVEGTMRWKNFTIHSGVINVSENPQKVVVEADAGYLYEASEDSAELNDESPETKMIGQVTAVFTPF